MKRTPDGLLAALAVVCFLASCTKQMDHLGNGNDLTAYRITGFRFLSTGNDTLAFHYDQWGNPVTVTRPNPGTGAPNYEFRYDRYHRLTDFIGIYAGGKAATGAEQWHRYFYDAKGFITLDSVYNLVNIVNGTIGSYNNSYANTLQYDAQGRVAYETRVWDHITYNYPYNYDSTGNLTGNAYDNKVNFHRTNLIWMFIDRDYSLNNPFVAKTYNAGRLPLSFTIPGENTHAIFLGDNYYSTADISYALK